ncbi:MAG: periplasmic heavy metal sensor [Planctomycetia bacterium]|nr:periplasmic heavy metal sensor [Planctomycetia bacterium]
MLATRWMAPLVIVGLLGVGAAAAPSTKPADGDFMAGKFRDTPLGRLIGGNIGRLMVLRSEANVTPEQREKVKEIVKGHKAEIGDVVKDLVGKRRALREAITSDKPDDAVIRKAADELGHSIGNAAVLGSKVRGELKPVFTEQQIELFHKFVKDHDGSVDRWMTEAFAQ